MDIQPTSRPVTPPMQASSAASPISSDFQDFIKLLTAQAKYQDPLQPLDSTEYVAQLAQFSAVEQQVLTNKLMGIQNDLAAMASMASLSTWVGMEARAAAPTRFDGSAVTVLAHPTPGADQVNLVVRDSSGSEIDRVPVSTDGGNVVWHGQNPETGTAFPTGTYSFHIENRAQNELIGSDLGEVYGRVTEVRVSDGQVVLLTQGGTEVPSDRVTAIRQ